eukprot:TRINITY_DN11636_c0_g1_i12.p1 TRINITY_DN11636_c0_g1~~TRINITY_DN11636_c0_g1_i12.p1  ORF type:complete len:243 (-),score=46.14 TRINITY_DN11636_c0_g1_i12:263-991(-)
MDDGQMTNLDIAPTSWEANSYKVPVPYLRPRVLNKDQPEPGKTRFVPTLADGPEHSFGRGKKGATQKNCLYGKGAKVPPVSYLPLEDWVAGVKKTGRTEKEAKSVRGSFVDAIYFNARKYNLPGPNKYFPSSKKENKQSVKKVDKKQTRPNFLSDYEYLGMNIPGPGSYRFKDTWTSQPKKRAVTADSKKSRSRKTNPCGPGRYEIVRLMTVKEVNKEKQIRAFAHIPIFERTTLGLINKVI